MGIGDMNHFSELQSQHETLLQQESVGNQILAAVQAYIEDVRFKSSDVSLPQEREQLRANTRYWGSYVYKQTGNFPNTELAPFSGEIVEETAVSPAIPKPIILAGIGIILMIALSLFALLIFGDNFAGEETDITVSAPTVTPIPSESEDGTSTPTPLPIITPVTTPISQDSLNIVTSENVRQMQPLMTLGGDTGAILDVAFSPDGQQLAASGADGSVRLWNMNNINAPSWTLKLDQTGWTQVVTYSPNGLQIATGGNDRAVRIADTDGYPFAQFSGHKGFIFGMDYTPDSLQLVSGDGDGVLILWNVGSGGLLSATTVGKDTIHALAFSPKQEFLAVANGTDGFKLLAYPSLRQMCAINGFSVLTTAVSNDNASIMIGTGDGLLLRTDPNCTIIDRTQAHRGAVNSVALSANGSMMVSGGSDGVVFITPDEISLTGHTDSVESVAINPAGTLIASASADGTIILWGIPNN